MGKGLMPDFYYISVHEIDLARLRAMGIRGLIVDLDNTLVAHNDPNATQDVHAWLEKVREAGLSMMIVSNNSGQRVENFSTLVERPFIPSAKKPLRNSFLKASAQMGLPPEQIAVIGDQVYTDVWGGNRCGMITILTEPIFEKETNLIRFKRWAENGVRRKMRK